jgi:hypothetical protein
MPSLSPRQKILSIFASAILACGQGCTDRDRELAAKKGDGTETFKFQKPEAEKKGQPKPIVKDGPVPRRDSDGTDTFKFKPDPRINSRPTNR